MRNARTLGLAVALALACASAGAVDVDRIEIRSRLGEPLLAEIPITGATPAEVQQLQAQLASSTTFARIGLPRPQGVVADLRFEVVRGPRPVIRVTSTRPVEQEFLTFLVQVDSAQGRLVREYSVALGASPSLPSAVAPQIQAPVQAAGNAIQRAPVEIDPANALPAPIEPVVQAPVVAPAPPIPVAGAPEPAPMPIPLSTDRQRPAATPAPRAAGATSAPAQRPRPAATTAAPTPARPAPAPSRAVAPRPAPAPVPAAPAAPRPGDYVVKAGDNLSGVVEDMQFAGVTEQQAMLAVLRTNPDAFGKGNINLLNRGAVLRRPASTELTRLDPVAAEAMVRLQIEQWRSGNMPDPPPMVPAAAAANPASVPAAPVADSVAQTPGGAIAQPRLEIAPSDESTAQGPGSGASATQVSPERAAADLVAARYTEFQEMQARIADLEQSQKQQQQLLAIKDAQLAEQRPQLAGIWPWLVALAAVLVAIGAWWGRGRSQRTGKVVSRLSESFSKDSEDRTPA